MKNHFADINRIKISYYLIYIVLNLILTPYIIKVFLELSPTYRSSGMRDFMSYLIYPISLLSGIHFIIGPALIIALLLINIVFSRIIYKKLKSAVRLPLFRGWCLISGIISFLVLIIILVGLIIFSNYHFDLRT